MFCCASLLGAVAQEGLNINTRGQGSGRLCCLCMRTVSTSPHGTGSQTPCRLPLWDTTLLVALVVYASLLPAPEVNSNISVWQLDGFAKHSFLRFYLWHSGNWRALLRCSLQKIHAHIRYYCFRNQMLLIIINNGCDKKSTRTIWAWNQSS